MYRIKCKCKQSEKNFKFDIGPSYEDDCCTKPKEDPKKDEPKDEDPKNANSYNDPKDDDLDRAPENDAPPENDENPKKPEDAPKEDTSEEDEPKKDADPDAIRIVKSKSEQRRLAKSGIKSLVKNARLDETKK